MLQVSLRRRGPGELTLLLSYSFSFLQLSRSFIQCFARSSQRVCLAVRSCVFMRSAKAINIVIILPRSPVAAFARRFTVLNSPFVVISRSAALRIRFAPLLLLIITAMPYLCGALSTALRLPVASCRLDGFQPETLPRG